MTSTIQVAVILGSTREGRLCDRIAGWTLDEVGRQSGFAPDRIDPLDFDLPSGHEERPSARLQALRQRLGEAQAFIVVTPEYNHAYPAALKFLIDSAYEPWRAKPVAFVSYGGISGGLRAVEQLRLVFAELHAVTIRNSVSFSDVWSRFAPDGTLRDPEAARRSMEAMLRQLHWWAEALREARGKLPYEEVVR
jgi:NAD(P)H-dependent FMN reductase